MKGLNLPPVGKSYATPEQIGFNYTGPDFSRPSLRQMPRHWRLDDIDSSRPGVRGWLNAALWLALLLGYLGMLRAVLT